jgi:glycosyltransferase involved in cell wall biosynthesis
MPLFTIITVTYNAESFIETSIKSVLSQTFNDYEYIIIDGGSTDTTVNIIKQYDQRITRFISEADEGIYDAMNKGLNIASGNYILFVGADDLLNDENVLNDIAKELAGNNFDFISGNVVYNTGRKFLSKFSFKMLLNNTVHHQSIFYHRSLFSNFRYDTAFKLIADYELNIRLYRNRKTLKYKFIDRTISICYASGASRTQLSRARRETNRIRLKVLGNRSFFFEWIYLAKFFFTSYVIRYNHL